MRQRARDRVGTPTASLSSYLLLPVSQQRAQTATPVKHFRSHRAFGDPEDPGDFSMGVTLDIEQDHRGAAPRWSCSMSRVTPMLKSPGSSGSPKARCDRKCFTGVAVCARCWLTGRSRYDERDAVGVSTRSRARCRIAERAGTEG